MSTVLITGAARRIGAALAKDLHQNGYTVVIHYHGSQTAAQTLCAQLCEQRAHSAIAVTADLSDPAQIKRLAAQTMDAFGELTALINNAAIFSPTPVHHISPAQWDTFFAINARAPLLLSQALAEPLRESAGAIVNILDIYAQRPLDEHPVYCASKAALYSLTQSLAQSLAPKVRVNGVAPGAILWPEQQSAAPNPDEQSALLARVPLGRIGDTMAITETVRFLLTASYVTGQIIAVDGGRSVMP